MNDFVLDLWATHPLFNAKLGTGGTNDVEVFMQGVRLMLNYGF